MMDMAAIILLNTLRHAVSRKMFCERCEVCLDLREAVHVEGHVKGRHGSAVMCGDCYDSAWSTISAAFDSERSTLVIDGRTHTASDHRAAARF